MTTAGARAVRWLDRLLLAELLVLTFLLGCFLDPDTDIWWHLRAGRDILAGGGIPRIDTYLFSADGAPWIDLHWGFQVIASWLFARHGFAALTLGAAAAAVAAVALGLVGTARTRSAVAVVWCWLPAVVVMSARFFPRPEILSLVCLAAFLCILHEADRRPRLLWALVPLQWLWVNVQGLFVLGLVVLGCWLVDRLLAGAMRRTHSGWRHRWAAPVAVVGVSVANPYGWQGVVFPLTLFRRMSTESEFYGRHIGELMSIPDLVWRTGVSSVYLRVSLVLLVAAAASFALRRHRGAYVYFRALAFLLFAGLGLLASRNQPQFALVAGAVLAWNVGDWLVTRPKAPLVEQAIARILTSAVLVGLMLWVAQGGFYAYAGEGRLVGLGEQPAWYAHDAARFAARPGMPPHVVAFHEGQAAVLEFHMRPDQQVYVDPRLEVTPRIALERYYELAAAMARRDETWPAQLARLPQPLALLVDHVSHHPVESTLLASSGWRCVWFDGVAGVYVQSGEARLAAGAIDFSAWHFTGGGQTARPVRPDGGGVATPLERLHQAEALLSVGRGLTGPDVAARRSGQVLVLLGAAQARELLSEAPLSARTAELLANASLSIHAPPTAEASLGDWLPEMTLGLARARSFLTRASALEPEDFQRALTMVGIARTLGDPDALWVTGSRLASVTARTDAQFDVQRQVRVLLRQVLGARAAEVPPLPPLNASEAVLLVRELVAQRRYLRALDTLEGFLRDGVPPSEVPWDLADLRATLLLLAGDPVRAREVWSEAAPRAEPRSLLDRRLASTYFVEGRIPMAAERYSAAVSSDPHQSAARYGLAMSYLELGDALGVVRECRAAAVSGDLPKPLAESCADAVAIAEPYTRPAAQ